MTDTEKRVSEIRARLDAATPGPWETTDEGEITARETHIGNINRAEDFPCLDPEDDADLARLEAEFAANAQFVAHAPGDIQFLLELVGGVGRTGGSA